MLLRPRPRRALTLIELLVVIAVLAVLAALTTAAVIKYLGTQEVANTQTVLDRTHSQLTRSYSAVKDEAHREPIQTDTDQWIRANLAGNDANATGRVRVLYVKLKLRQAFPMNFTEALYPPVGLDSKPCTCGQLQPLAAYVAYLHSRGVQISAGMSWESSACLLMALQRKVSGMGVDPASLTAGGAGGVDDTYGVPILTDAWHRPILFSRVPVGCPVLNPNGAQFGAHDPEDPQGFLQTPGWGATYGGLFTSLTQQQLAPGDKSLVIAPMVASGGPTNDMANGFNPVTFSPPVGGSALFNR